MRQSTTTPQSSALVVAIEYGSFNGDRLARRAAEAQFAFWGSSDWQRIEAAWFDLVQSIRAQDAATADALEDCLALAVTQALAFAVATDR
jgi:hypothetical protein